jgi:hypothetical protein
MPTVINFSATGVRVAAPPAPVLSVSYDTASLARTVTDGGLDVDRTISYTQNVSARATVAVTDSGAACPLSAAQDSRFIVDAAARTVVPSLAQSTGVPVYGGVNFSTPRSGLFSVPVLVSATTTETSRTYTVRAGTVAEHVEAAIAALVQGKTAGDATQRLYSANNYSLSSPAVTRNTNLFCGAFDWTGMSVASYDGGNIGSNSACPAHMISPWHAITAYHYTQSSADTYVFQGADGSIHIRTKLAGLTQIGSTDVCLITLNAALPVTGASRVNTFQLLPQNFTDYLSPGYYRLADNTREFNGGMIHALKRKRLPAVSSYDTVGVSPAYLAGSSGATWLATVQAAPSRSSLYPTWNRTWASGDSGSGVFLPIGGELVLAMTGESINQNGPSPSRDLSALRSAMESTVPGSTASYPRIADLSGFSVL